MNDDKKKVHLMAPYLDWKIITSNPTEEEIGKEFDRMYEKSETELNVFYNIFKKKLTSIKNNNVES